VKIGLLNEAWHQDTASGRLGSVPFPADGVDDFPGIATISDSRNEPHHYQTAVETAAQPTGSKNHMSISIARKAEVRKDHSRHDSDTGSPEVQIAILTDRIKNLQDHFTGHKHDHHSRRGLLAMVSRRNSLLRYLQRTNRDNYLETIKKLGLRK
jgi:small subunit ribosomal protein S15